MLKKGRVVAQGPTGAVMEESILRDVLGDNIQTDVTVGGLPVVTSRALTCGGARVRRRTAGGRRDAVRLL